MRHPDMELTLEEFASHYGGLSHLDDWLCRRHFSCNGYGLLQKTVQELADAVPSVARWAQRWVQRGRFE